MKNYEEMAETVFRRIDEYKETQKKRRKIIYGATASLTCACLVAVMGFAVWRSGNLKPSGNIQGTEGTVSNPSSPVILQVPTEDITEPTSAPLPPEPPYPIGNGGTPNPICTVHMPQAHQFTNSLINYVGQENFMEWVQGVELLDATEGCRKPSRTIYEFIKYFDVPKSVFEEIYYSGCYAVDYFDVDLFYSGDEEAIEAFLRDKDTAEKILDKRFAFDELKYGVYVEYNKAFKEKFGDVSHNKVTFADMVRELNVPLELLEDYATKTTTGRSYNYVFDLLYLKPGESVKLKSGETVTYDDFNAMLAEAANDPYPVRASDAIICGVEDYTTQ